MHTDIKYSKKYFEAWKKSKTQCHICGLIYSEEWTKELFNKEYPLCRLCNTFITNNGYIYLGSHVEDTKKIYNILHDNGKIESFNKAELFKYYKIID